MAEKSESYAHQTNLQKLRDKHLALAREIVNGATHIEAATRCGFSEGRVAQIVQAPLFQAELARLRAEIDNFFIQAAAHTEATSKEEVKGRINQEVMKSLQTLINLRDDDEESGSVRQKSALEILNLGGYKAEEKVGPTVIVEVGEGLKAMLHSALEKEKAGAAKKEPSIEEIRKAEDGSL